MHEMSSLIFSEKYKKKVIKMLSTAGIVICTFKG